ncbi:MAG: STAS domain-containing protein [Spirochaetota bacterium]
MTEEKLCDHHFQGEILIIHFLTGIESSEVLELKNRIISLISDNRSAMVIYDFSAVPFIDSSGIGMFVNIQRELNNSFAARFCNINDRIRQSFESMHLFKIFTVDETLDESIAAFTTKE